MTITPLPELDEPAEVTPPLAPPWARLSAWVGLLACVVSVGQLTGLIITMGALFTGRLDANGFVDWGGFFIAHGIAFAGVAVALVALTWVLALLKPKAQRAWYIDGRLWSLAALFTAVPVLWVGVQIHARDARARRGPVTGTGARP